MPDEAPETPEETADDTGAATATASAGRPLPENSVLRSVIEPQEDVEYLVSAGQDVVMVPKDRLADVAGAFKDAGFELLADVTAVDYLGAKRVRFEVVVNLVSVQHGSRIRIRTAVPADDATVPSLVALYPGANFFEREVFLRTGLATAILCGLHHRF